MFNKDYLLLSTQTALLGHVSPLLRAVTVDFDEDEKLITLRFFYDSEVDDQLFELASCTATEIDLGPEYPSFYEINGDFAVSLKFPEKIYVKGTLVFLRNEPNVGEYTKKLHIVLDRKDPFVSLRLVVQQALLGKVTPNLRAVGLDLNQDKKEMHFYFNYDGEISENEYGLAAATIKEVSSTFLEYCVNHHVKRVDFPQGELEKGERLVYLRYEFQYEM